MNKYVVGLPGNNVQELIVAITVGPGELWRWCTRLRETNPCMHQRCSLEDGIAGDVWDRCRATGAEQTRDFQRVGSGPIVSGHVQERHAHSVLGRSEVNLYGVDIIWKPYAGADVVLYRGAVRLIHPQAEVLGGVSGEGRRHLFHAS